MFGLGSFSQLGIGVAIRLDDQFSATANRVNNSLKKMKENTHSAVTAAMTDYRNHAAGIAAGALGASSAMISAAKAGAEFQHSINQVYIVGEGKIGKSRKDLASFATGLTKQFTRSPLEVSRAMFENVKAGVTTGLEEITKYQIAAATATDEVLEGPGGVAQNLLAIMNSMDLPISKFKEITNASVAAANASMASVYDIGESMQYAAFTAHQFNIPLEQTLSLIAKLSQANIRGSAAGTGINNMLKQLAKTLGPNATKKSIANWGMLGLDMKQMEELANNGRVFDIIKAIEEASASMPSVKRQSILTALFNMRGDKALEGMFTSKNGNKTLGDFLQEIQKGVSSDIAMNQSRRMMNDLDSEFNFWVNALHRFRISFMKAAEPTIRWLVRAGTAVVSFVGSLLETPIGKIIASAAVVLVPTIGIIFAFRAALLTATLALRVMSLGGGARGVGGFWGLMGAGLGNAGRSRMIAGGMNPAIVAGLRNGTMMRNSAGSIINSATKRIVTIGANASMYAGVGRAGAMGAGLGGLLRGGLGLLGRAVPILGGILLGMQVLEMITGGIWDEAKKQNKLVNDPLINTYYRNLDQAYLGYNETDEVYNSRNSSRIQRMYHGSSVNNPRLTQIINLNVDGQGTMQRTVQQQIDDDLMKSLDMTFNY